MADNTGNFVNPLCGRLEKDVIRNILYFFSQNKVCHETVVNHERFCPGKVCSLTGKATEF